MQDRCCSSAANTGSKRIKVVALFPFCRKRYSPKGRFREFFEDKNRSGKQGTFSILLIAYIGSKSTPPYLPFVKKYGFRFLMEHGFFLVPPLEILFHDCGSICIFIIRILSFPSI